MDENTNTVNRNQKRYKQTISNDLRQLIINKMNRGFTPQDLSIIYDVKANTISHMYSNYKKTGFTEKQKTGHRRSLLNNEQKEQICDWIDDNCSLTLKQLRVKCLATYPTIEDISEKTIERALKDFHYSFKRTIVVPEVRNTEEVIQKRFDFAMKYNQILAERNKMFWIDEYGISVTSRSRYGRSVKGSKPVKRVPTVRTRNYSVCAAMNDNSLTTISNPGQTI